MADPDVYLLVEGKNDKHVIKNLCIQNQIPVPEIQTPGEAEGIEALLEGLEYRLNAQFLRTIGIVVDADDDLPARWQSVRGRLHAAGYLDVPRYPIAEGWISSTPGLPRAGTWIMPDNQVSGMLEDFVTRLISVDDNLRPKSEEVLSEIEDAGLNRYRLVHHPKAFIHTWLAWQETPGMPMGQAITARALRHDSPLALDFVAWLRRLFEVA